MRGFSLALLSAVLAAHSAIATPIRARSPYVVKETHNPPREWTKLDRSKGDHVISLQIGLKQGNFAELEKQLYEGRREPSLYPSSTSAIINAVDG